MMDTFAIYWSESLENKYLEHIPRLIQLGIFFRKDTKRREAGMAPILVAREIRPLGSYRLLKYLESRDE